MPDEGGAEASGAASDPGVGAVGGTGKAESGWSGGGASGEERT